MRFDEHCERSEAMLGERFEQVHIWLDHFAWVQSTPTTEASYNPIHRRFRHHMTGIITLWRQWERDHGAECAKRAALAATRHVLDDLFGPMCNDVGRIPKNEAEYVDMFGVP